MTCHYCLLRVTPADDAARIRSAYRKLSLENHPDKHEESRRAEQTAIFQQIVAAYQALSDDTARSEYNRLKGCPKCFPPDAHQTFNSRVAELFAAWEFTPPWAPFSQPQAPNVYSDWGVPVPPTPKFTSHWDAHVPPTPKFNSDWDARVPPTPKFNSTWGEPSPGAVPPTPKFNSDWDWDARVPPIPKFDTGFARSSPFVDPPASDFSGVRPTLPRRPRASMGQAVPKAPKFSSRFSAGQSSFFAPRQPRFSSRFSVGQSSFFAPRRSDFSGVRPSLGGRRPFSVARPVCPRGRRPSSPFIGSTSNKSAEKASSAAPSSDTQPDQFASRKSWREKLDTLKKYPPANPNQFLGGKSPPGSEPVNVHESAKDYDIPDASRSSENIHTQSLFSEFDDLEVDEWILSIDEELLQSGMGGKHR